MVQWKHRYIDFPNRVKYTWPGMRRPAAVPKAGTTKTHRICDIVVIYEPYDELINVGSSNR